MASIKPISDVKFYVCSGCNLHYDYSKSLNTISGRLPYVLKCKHTLCLECIMKSFRRRKVIVCAICLEETEHAFNKTFQEVLKFNYYILGHIFAAKQDANRNHSNSIGLVSSGVSTMSRSFTSEDLSEFELDSGETCGFGSCKSPATRRCIDCNGSYCFNCCIALHKSGKALVNHTIEHVGGISLELEKCDEHNILKELFCENCNEEACCYCFLENHEGHQRNYLSRLSKSDMEELDELKAKVMRTLQQLQATHKQIKEFDDEISPVQCEIGQYFGNLHARLYAIERDLRDQVDFQDETSVNKSIAGLRRFCLKNIAVLKQLIEKASDIESHKLNFKMLISKLREYEDFPCYLLRDNGDTSAGLIVHEVLNDLEDYFTLNNTKAGGYTLVNSSSLPDDYCYSKIQDSDSESVASSTQTFSSNSSQKTLVKRSQGPMKATCGKNLNNQFVYLTHIHSLDNFYVRLKNQDRQFSDIKKTIANHIKQGVVSVERVNLNELYLAKFLPEKNKGDWCRVRVVNEKLAGAEFLYEIFYIDYGHSKIVKKDQLKHLSISLAKKPSLVFRCRLHNPGDSPWAEKSHIQLVKITEGNELVLFVKDYANQVYEVDLNIFTSTGGLTSISTILIVACDALRNQSNASENSLTENHSRFNQIYESSEQFKNGDTTEVYVRYVIDPENIYVQKTSYESSLESLQNSLNNYYNNKNAESCVPIQGSDLVVKVETTWHRGRVQSVLVNEKYATVFLVDWGRTVQIPWIQTRILVEQFKALECLVISVKLADISPPKGSKKWSINVMEFFKKYVAEKKALKMAVSQSEPLTVALFDVHSTYDICINTLLVQENLAESTGPLSATTTWLHNQEDKEEDNGFVVSLLKKSVLEDEDDDEDDAECIKKQIEIVRFVNPDAIYFKRITDKDLADKLHQELQIHYNSMDELTDEKWKINDRCVIHHSAKNFFYRGLIKDVKDGTYVIYLTDEGVEISVDRSLIFKLNQYFGKFPSMAYKCDLANVEPAGDRNKWSNIAIDFCQDIFDGYKDIYISKIKEDVRRQSMAVLLWYCHATEGSALEPVRMKMKCLNKKLVKAGLALKTGNLDLERKTLLETDLTTKNDEKTEITRDKSPDSTETEESTESVIEQITMKELVDWKPPIPITKREFFAFVTCAEAEGHLYIRDEEFHPIYKDMEEKLKQYFDLIPKPRDVEWHEDQMCTIHENDHWYRGKILKVLDKTQVQAIMIDFGSDHIVKTKNLHNEVMYPDLPTFAVKIKLYDVHSRSGSWLTSDIDTLLNTVDDYSKICIVGSLNAQLPLAEVYDADGANLNDLIVSKCPNLMRRRTENFEDEDDKIEDILIERIEQACLEAKNPKSWNDLLDLEQQELGGCDLLKTPFPETSGSQVTVEIINVINHNTVSLRIIDESIEFVGTEQEFEELTETLQKQSQDLPELKDYDVGTPCIALFSEDSRWYRAKIFDNKELSDSVTVFFVDYGNFDVVRLEDLKVPRDEWLEFPMRYLVATIPIEIVDNEQEAVITNYMTELCETTKYAQVIDNNPLQIHVYENKDELYYEKYLKSDAIKVGH